MAKTPVTHQLSMSYVRWVLSLTDQAKHVTNNWPTKNWPSELRFSILAHLLQLDSLL